MCHELCKAANRLGLLKFGANRDAVERCNANRLGLLKFGANRDADGASAPFQGREWWGQNGVQARSKNA